MEYIFEDNVTGSPPRVREKLPAGQFLWTKTGITPACAGKTDQVETWDRGRRDHPRVCGKNSIKLSTPSRLMGSPPRVREKLHFRLDNSSTLRITPACAGKTSRYLPIPTPSRDHPRVCGKNIDNFRTGWQEVGSPPRVREKLVIIVNRAANIGITPACAGKTPSTKALNFLLWDHPRVCGKNLVQLLL